MEIKNGKLHIVVFPWLAFGHMIPFLELSKRLAQMGHLVSFISTPRNIDRLPTIPPDLQLHLNLVKLTPPPIEGLCEDAQSTIDVSIDEISLIQKLQDGLEGPLCDYIEAADHGHSPDWIIYDMGVYWAPRVASKYGISSVFFGSFSAMTLCFIGPPSVMLDSGDQTMEPEQLTIPPPWIPFPTQVAFRYHEAMQVIRVTRSSSSGSGVAENYRLGMTFQGCQVAAVRSCIGFESEWVPLLGQLYQKPIFPVGFLSPSGPEITRGGDDSSSVWLDKKPSGSTVYVAFGSECRLSKEQVHEIAFGLELSELHFFWAYKGDPGLLPVGFEDRTNGRGFVHVGWAPQARLLSHTSIGGFLTHGGWGSTIEGLTLGKPLIMLPMFADQGLNTRAMEGRKVGVEVPRNERDGSFTRDSVAKCLKLVMVDDEGGIIRSNVREMMKIFRDKERENQYIGEFVNYLIKHRLQVGVSGSAPSL